METKKPYQSKTLWVNLVLALLALAAPGARDFIVANPQIVAVGFAVINIVLRLITKGAIQLQDDSATPAAPTQPSA